MIAAHAGSYIQPNGIIDQQFAIIVTKGQPAGLRMFTTLWHFAEIDDYSIGFTIQLTSNHKATDFRDKIYALLNIGSDRVRNFFPDYSKSMEEDFMSLVKCSIDSRSDLDILLGNRQESTKNEFRPSWLIQAQGYLRGGSAWVNEKGLLQAAADLTANANVDDEKGLLAAHGIFVGVSKDAVGPFTLTSKNPIANSATIDVSALINSTDVEASVNNLIKFCRSLDEAKKETAWRMLTMDQDQTDWDEIVSPAPSEFGKMLQVFIGAGEVPEEFEPQIPKTQRGLGYCFPFIRNMEECTINRCFFSTECGQLGLGPYSAKAGDNVTILFGLELCFVFRPKGSRS